MSHVLTMAGTGTIGLMAIFVVDLLNFFYISELHDATLTGAIAFATSISYLQISVSIGLSIGLGACTGRLLGAHQHEKARRLSSVFITIMVFATLLFGVGIAFWSSEILVALGAQGAALQQASRFLSIISPAMPIGCLGMALSSLLRAVGDARQAMRMTLVGACVAACLDPLLIFGFHLGLEGAAISTVLSRIAVAASGFLGLRGHAMLERPDFTAFSPALRQIGGIAAPAIATNIATPVGGLFVTRAMSKFGLDAVSGQATIERIVPVAFALVFALTGSVGPIMAQNLGARQFGRVEETLTVSLKLTMLCVFVTWLVMAVGHNFILQAFGVRHQGADIVRLFCCYLVLSYLFVGLLFVSNTAFNNLGHPFYSTGFNWGRATFGTIPFVWIGAHYYGAIGILMGQALGVTLFGTGAILTAYRVVRRLGRSRTD